MYLVPGGCTWSRGVPGLGGVSGPGGLPGLGGVPGPGWLYLVLGGVPGPGGIPGPRGCTWSWGVYLVQGVYLAGGVPAQVLPPVNRMTDRCKNITLPQTSFAGGNEFKFFFHRRNA